MSLFQSTTKYGLQMALWLPSLLQCRDFRLDADLRWGAKKEIRTFHLEKADGLVSHLSDAGAFQPQEFDAFLARFRQIAPGWQIEPADTVHRGAGQGGLTRVWVPDFNLTHLKSGKIIQFEILGFWRKTSLTELLDWVPKIRGVEPLWAISEKWRVDESTEISEENRVLTFRDIPNATDVLAAAERLVAGQS
jgi:predicted nuclease of restriction endonuclease-like RecB superfamily